MQQQSTISSSFPAAKLLGSPLAGVKSARPSTFASNTMPPGSSRIRLKRPMLNFQTRFSQQATQDANDQRGSSSGGRVCNRGVDDSLLDSLLTNVRQPGLGDPAPKEQPTDFSRLFDGKAAPYNIPRSNGNAGSVVDSEMSWSATARSDQPSAVNTSFSTVGYGGGGASGVFARATKPASAMPSGKQFEDMASFKGVSSEDKENAVPAADGEREVSMTVRGHVMRADFLAGATLKEDSSRTAACHTTGSQRSCRMEAGQDAQEQQQQLVDPPASRRPPLDMSLKTLLQFTSDRPFRIVEDLPSPDAWSQPATPPGQTLTNEERYKRALQSYAYPGDPMDPSDVNATAATKSGSKRMRERRERWEAAFFSLYSKVQDGSVDLFYYVSPMGTKRGHFTVLVRGPTIGGTDCLTATVSRSSSAMRAHLQAEGVLFQMPFAPSTAQSALCRQDTWSSEQVATAATTTATSAAAAAAVAAVINGTPASALLLSGALAVGGLFQVLDYGGGCGDALGKLFEAACDVPMLLAPLPFVHASLQALQPQVVVSSLRVITKKQRLSDSQTPKFKVRMEGIIPPWVVDRLVLALASMQECRMKVALDTLWHSCSLSTQPHQAEFDKAASGATSCNSKCSSGNGDEASETRAGWSSRGYVSAEEAKRWHQRATGALENGAAAVAALEYEPSSRLVQARLGRPRKPIFTPAVHAWQ